MRVKTGKPVGYDRLRWRGIALSTFDGRRWSKSAEEPAKLSASPADGAIHPSLEDQNPKAPALGVQYDVFLEPVATDVIFAPADVIYLS
jgi:hypothetical protein